MLVVYAKTAWALIGVWRKYGPIRIRKGSTDLHVFQQLFLYNDYELDSLGFQPEIIVDAGAYVGYSALFFHLAYPQARIASIEPSTSNFECLLYNTRHIPHVRLYHCGLWSKPAFLQIHDRKTGNWGFQTIEVSEDADWDVKTVDVPTLMQDLNTDRIDIFKIDIEGSEMELFRNHPEWASQVRVFIIEFHERIFPGCTDLFRTAISAHKWREFQRGENLIFVRTDWPA